MGQQQLLLVILVTIIVGIATVVAINVFGTAADEANRDAVRQDLMSAATQAQGAYVRPLSMNGLGRDFGATGGADGGLTDAELLRRLNVPGERSADGSEVENENGTYSIEARGEQTLTLRGEPTSGGDWIQLQITWNTDTEVWDFTWTEDDT